MEEAALISIVVIVALGIFSQWLAWRVQWPSIVIMSLGGLLIGPIFGLINPQAALGELYSPLISLAVAIILFEGSSSLDIREIKGVSKSIFRIITFGAFISWILGSLAAHYIAGLTLEVSFIIGGLFIVTGPTVIIPLLRNAKLKQRTAAVLKWEGIIVDPAGPLLALFAYEVIKVLTHEALTATYLLQFIGAAFLAAIIGFVAGVGISILANKGFFPEYLKSPIILATVLLSFTGAEIIMHETGMLTVTVMGLAMARMKRYVSSIGNISHFVENISVLLTSTVFILLTASLSRATIAEVFTLPILGFVLAMLFVVRPLSIWVPTTGTELTIQEKTLIGWIAPRGIVALTVAGYFASILANDGYEEASLLMTLTFALVFITVCAHGFTLGPIAKKLNLANTQPPGVLMVGSSSFSIALGQKIKEMGHPVLIADTSEGRLRPAMNVSLDTYKGDILSEHAQYETDLTQYDSILAMTADASYNALVSQTFAPEFGFNHTFSLPSTHHDQVNQGALPQAIKAHLLFDEGAVFPELNKRINTTYSLETHVITEGGSKDMNAFGKKSIPLLIKRDNETLKFMTTNKKVSLEEGDQLVILTESS